MSNDAAKVDADRELLRDAHAKGSGAVLGAYLRLSGPGWLQSAITLGGGSLASGLYLGVLTGTSMLWLQPLAMIFGIVMLSAIAYVTTTTGERPFQAINRHVNPVLGWSWALASLAANMVWSLPQFSLANAVMRQNLAPDTLGPGGSLEQAAAGWLGEGSWIAANAGTLAISITILIVTIAITWAYDSGSWGIRLYELVLKCMVGMIVLCFVGVVARLAMSPGGLDWGQVAGGFIPDFSRFVRPADTFAPLLDALAPEQRAFWVEQIVSKQRDVMISAAATAVGINMTFLFPYSILRKGWTREFRGLVVFDLATGMFIPFVLATSCVVIASASQFHTQPVAGLLDEVGTDGQPVEVSPKARTEMRKLLSPRLAAEMDVKEFTDLSADSEAFDRRLDALPEADRRLAAALVDRDAFDLSASLRGLFTDGEGRGGEFFAKIIFGLGVLGMTLSTITILMLISGFVICEIFGLPQGGWPHRLGCLAAATGVLGPFLWSKAAFYLAVPTSVFGFVLLPIAYLTFFLLMNQRSLLGADMPRGAMRLVWNLLMILATVIAAGLSGWVIWSKSGYYGAGAAGTLILVAIVVQMARRPAESST